MQCNAMSPPSLPPALLPPALPPYLTQHPGRSHGARIHLLHRPHVLLLHHHACPYQRPRSFVIPLFGLFPSSISLREKGRGGGGGGRAGGREGGRGGKALCPGLASAELLGISVERWDLSVWFRSRQNCHVFDLVGKCNRTRCLRC